MAILFFAVLAMPGSAQSNIYVASSQDRAEPVYAGGYVNLVVEKEPLEDVLKRLMRAGAPLVYPSHLVAETQLVSCSCSNVRLTTALDRMLRGTNVGFRLLEATGQIALVPAPAPEPRVVVVGTLRGRVVEQASGQGLGEVQVSVVGTELGTISNIDGDYNLSQVPAGQQRIRAERLGYHAVEQDVVVADSGVTIVNLTMRQNPIKLDPLGALISTGTLVDTEKRALGTSIAVVTEDDIRQSGATELRQLLSGTVSGVTSFTPSGLKGSGGHIQIRGVSSMLLEQAPLVYVDGVPIDNGSSALRERINISAPGDFGAHVRLDEIPLDQVERIEVVKGPAATTLYGSQAANGVIQIFTKRGVPGPTRVTATAELGRSSANTEDSFVALSPYGDRLRTLFRDPRTSRYSATVSGGQGSLTYNIGATHTSSDGTALGNGSDQNSLNVSFGRFAGDGFTLRVSGTFLQRSYANRSYSTLFNYVERGEGSALGYASLDEAIQFAPRTDTDVRRVYGAVDMSWRPFEIWDNQLTIGIDQSLEGNESRSRSTNASVGHTRDRITRDFDQISARYLGSIRYPRTGSLTSNLSFGAEARRDGVHLLSLRATGLPSGSIDGFGFAQQATITSEVSTAIGVVGFFVQEQVGIRDKLFLTAGLRADGSSAFGSNFGLQLYPKVSAAYILEPTSWWTTKLRAAWGRSGQLPEPFAHEMTFRLIRDYLSGLPTLRIGEIGNEDLRAEVGSEIEIGAEQYFLGNRASLELNYFRQTTTDAMLRSSVSPFYGVPAGPLTNLGNLRSQGVELSGQAMVADRPDFSLRLGFNITRMIDNGLVTKLNGLDELFAGNRQDWRFLFGIKEGRSMHALRFYNRESLVRSDTTPIYEFLGSSTPTTYGGFNTDLQVFRDFRLTSQWTYGLGGRGIDGNSISRDSDAGLIVTSYGAFQPEVMTSRYVHSTDHLRFDALRLTYNLPTTLLRGLADNAEFWVEGRNLALFDRWPSGDPTQISVEGGRGGGQFYTGFSQQSIPRPRDYLVGMRVGF